MKIKSEIIDISSMAREFVNEEQYFNAVTSYFSFLVTELGFNLPEKHTNSSFFMTVEYKRGSDLLVSIPYEQGDDYLDVTIFLLEDGREPHCDDLSKRLQLRRITSKVLADVAAEEMAANSRLFNQFKAHTTIEKRLLNAARVMRLVLLHGNFDV